MSFIRLIRPLCNSDIDLRRRTINIRVEMRFPPTVKLDVTRAASVWREKAQEAFPASWRQSGSLEVHLCKSIVYVVAGRSLCPSLIIGIRHKPVLVTSVLPVTRDHTPFLLINSYPSATGKEDTI